MEKKAQQHIRGVRHDSLNTSVLAAFYKCVVEDTPTFSITTWCGNCSWQEDTWAFAEGELPSQSPFRWVHLYQQAQDECGLHTQPMDFEMNRLFQTNGLFQTDGRDAEAWFSPGKGDTRR